MVAVDGAGQECRERGGFVVRKVKLHERDIGVTVGRGDAPACD